MMKTKMINATWWEALSPNWIIELPKICWKNKNYHFIIIDEPLTPVLRNNSALVGRRAYGGHLSRKCFQKHATSLHVVLFSLHSCKPSPSLHLLVMERFNCVFLTKMLFSCGYFGCICVVYLVKMFYNYISGTRIRREVSVWWREG